MKTVSVLNGTITASEIDGEGNTTRWEMRPDQAEKHLATFAGQTQKVAAGDVSLIKDASNDYKKEQQKLGL